AVDTKMMQRYMHLTSWCLKHRLITVVSAVLFLIGSVSLIPLLPTGFLPADDSSQTQVYLELAPGATLSQTTQSAEQARVLIKDIPHIKTIYTAVGGGYAGADAFVNSGVAESRQATLTILLDVRGSRPLKQVIVAYMRLELMFLAVVRSKVGLGGSGV
ncbi:MAG: hypothetical protein RLZZ541_270, partial [Pseudomonadota bacterium]